MKQKRSLKDAHHDVVSRYCPYLCENVVMLKSAGGGPDEFECLHAEQCRKREQVACKMMPGDASHEAKG